MLTFLPQDVPQSLYLSRAASCPISVFLSHPILIHDGD